MKTYGLYLESGPKHMKTMVHVPELLGCIATGPTSDDAVAAAPEEIGLFLGFLAAHGEKADPEAAFKTKVVEHLDEPNRWLGNGSPYATYKPDLERVPASELETLLRRFGAMREALSSWAETATARDLERGAPDSSRTSRSILLHVVAGPGSYLSPVVGGTKGFAAVQGAVERGELSIAEGIRRVGAMAVEVARGTTAEQRKAVIQRPKEVRTLRKALRRMLEHDWEHLAELSRRPGGPAW